MEDPFDSMEVLGSTMICPFEGCHKGFHSRWSLTRHVRTHTGEKVTINTEISVESNEYRIKNTKLISNSAFRV
jgi:uncharacterized Zn-finger protein